jgi:hypothetical protein
MKHLMEQPDVTGMEEPFAGVIRKALAKEPKDRFQTVQEMIEAVFGAAHIQQSVSCFSPESLTMVAGRVAKKVGVGGPGSSGQVDVGTTQRAGGGAAPGAGEFGDRFSEKMDRLGERLGAAGERISRKMERVGQRIEERMHGRHKSAESQDVPVVPSPAVDPRRDPLSRPQRTFLGMLTAAFVAAGIAAFEGPDDTRWFVVTSVALFGSIVGAAIGLMVVHRKLGSNLSRESGLLRHLAYGTGACIGGALGYVVTIIAMNVTGVITRAMVREGDTTANSLLSLALPIFLLDWSRVLDPARKERILLGHALMAAAVGWLSGAVFGGGAAVVAGVLAGISLVVQARQAWDPLAARARRKPHKTKVHADLEFDWGAKREAPGQAVQPGEPQTQRQPDATARQSPVAFQTQLPPETLRQLPTVVRVILLLLGIAGLALGVGLLSAVLAGAAHPSEGAGFTLFGVASMVVSLLLLRMVRPGVYVNWWATLVRPVLITACIGALLIGALLLAKRPGGTTYTINGIDYTDVPLGLGVSRVPSAHAGSDQLAVAIFLIVFPAVSLLVLASLPKTLFGSRSGGAPPMAGPTPQPDPTRRQPAPPVQTPMTRETVRFLPAAVRAMLLLLGIAGLALGIGMLIAVATGAAGREDLEPCLFLGVVGLSLSFALLRLVRRGVYVNWWATLVRPVLIMACIGAILAGGYLLTWRPAGPTIMIDGTEYVEVPAGLGRISRVPVRSNDQLALAIFFIVFPAALLLVLTSLPRTLFHSRPRSHPPVAGPPRWQLFMGPDGEPILPPGVSPRKRLMAIVLAAAFWLTGLGGLHRFYVGKIGTGLLWLVTFGLLGIGQIVDMVLIATGHFKDKRGRRLVMWTDADELQSGWQSWGSTSAQPSPPAPADTANTPGDRPAEQPEYSPVQALPAPSWRSDISASRLPAWGNPTNPLLGFLSGLLMIVSLVAGMIGTVSVPAVTVAAALKPAIANQSWYDALTNGGWQEILNSLQVGLSAAFMLLAVILLIVARRWAGGAHMIRAVVGAAGMLLALHVFRLALNFEHIDWPQTASLIQHGYVQEGVAGILRHTYTGGMIMSGLLLLASTVILAWPPRRPQEGPAASVGKGV